MSPSSAEAYKAIQRRQTRDVLKRRFPLETPVKRDHCGSYTPERCIGEGCPCVDFPALAFPALSALIFGLIFEKADVAMAKSKQHAKRKRKQGQKTPPPAKEPKLPVIGSSCTWREAELDHLKVKVLREVDVRLMIPDKFWRFEHLEEYEECTI